MHGKSVTCLPLPKGKPENKHAGKYNSSNIYEKNIGPDITDYFLAYHFEGAEVTMQISFNDQGLISGFFILRMIPRCDIQTVYLIPTGNNEYFVYGYKYGGYNDFRVNYDKKEQSLFFNNDEVSFTAFKSR